ncbi:MAG: hypothetical protein ABFC77_12815 [Thermoguttaceae bacterium]
MKSFRPASGGIVVASAVWVVLIAMLGIVPWRLVAADATPAAPVGVAEKTVTVFPIVINSGAPMPGVSADMSKNMAELIGLFLERGGMKDIEIADAKFMPPQDADLAKAAEAFAQFVKSQKLKTEFAIFVQFFGKPGTGAVEIHLAVVDCQGKVVLTDRLDQQQLLAHGAKKVDPMLACYYTFQQLRPFWGLMDSNQQTAPEGKMAKLWAEKSGGPSKAEREAMQARLKVLKQTLKTDKIAVFVRVLGRSDPQAAATLAAMLAHDDLGRAEAVDVELPFKIKPNVNQVRILSDTAKAFQEFLRKNSPATDYALLADYGIGRSPDGKTVVGGVNLILCDRDGNWVVVTGRNSHQPDFQRIDPRSPDDCHRLIVEVMKQNLR